MDYFYIQFVLRELSVYSFVLPIVGLGITPAYTDSMLPSSNALGSWVPSRAEDMTSLELMDNTIVFQELGWEVVPVAAVGSGMGPPI